MKRVRIEYTEVVRTTMDYDIDPEHYKGIMGEDLEDAGVYDVDDYLSVFGGNARHTQTEPYGDMAPDWFEITGEV